MLPSTSTLSGHGELPAMLGPTTLKYAIAPRHHNKRIAGRTVSI